MKPFIMSFVHAGRGIGFAIAQRNLKAQLLVAAIVIAAAALIGVTVIEWCLLLGCVAAVTGMEMINSAIESLVDLVSPERRPTAGKVKDIAAGAVLWCSCVSAAIGVLIFLSHW
jgi:diacylglycerol kinase